MISPMDATISALKAFQKKLDVTSNNIANSNTNEFKRSRATLSEGAQGGVAVHITKEETPGIPIEESRDGTAIETETSNVDLAQEITDTIPAKRGYQANIKMLQTRNEMLGSLLDVIG
jgi:flagellar basal-body rod protein FlgC